MPPLHHINILNDRVYVLRSITLTPNSKYSHVWSHTQKGDRNSFTELSTVSPCCASKSLNQLPTAYGTMGLYHLKSNSKEQHQHYSTTCYIIYSCQPKILPQYCRLCVECVYSFILSQMIRGTGKYLYTVETIMLSRIFSY